MNPINNIVQSVQLVYGRHLLEPEDWLLVKTKA